jgi:hypothetical protein
MPHAISCSNDEPVCRAIAAGVRKMPEPMTPPTTTIVASQTPRRRA